MKAFIKKIVLITTSLTLTTAFISPLFASADNKFEVAAKAAIAIDADTGKVFYEKNSEEPLPIASMTKLITMYLIMEAIDQGKMSWDDQLEINEHLLNISRDMDLSNIGLSEGQTYSVQDLFNASALVSANAAVTALAEKIAGTEKDFVDLMRAKMTAWGITDSYLISTSGINNELAQGRTYPGSGEKEENLASAKDMAIVARHLLKDFPEVLEITSQPEIDFAVGTGDEVTMPTTNWMLEGGPNYREGVDGLKTGTTDLAGACFAGTYSDGQTRIVTIVMNADNSKEDEGSRFVETDKLIDFVYDNWEFKPLYKKGAVIGQLAVKNGEERKVPVKLKEDVNAWVNIKSGEQAYPMTVTDEAIPAGFEKEAAAGTATLNADDNRLGFVDPTQNNPSYQIVTNAAVKELPWYSIIGRTIGDFFTNLF